MTRSRLRDVVGSHRCTRSPRQPAATPPGSLPPHAVARSRWVDVLAGLPGSRSPVRAVNQATWRHVYEGVTFARAIRSLLFDTSEAGGEENLTPLRSGRSTRVGCAAILAALVLCSTGCSGHARSTVQRGTLTVQVVAFGGPGTIGGRMASAANPATGLNVVARNSSGRTWTARTDGEGQATFRLLPGRYAVSASICPTAHTPVLALSAGRSVSVQLECSR